MESTQNVIHASLSRTLAGHVAADHQLTPAYRNWMQLLLLDYYAVTAGGADRPSAHAARSSVGLTEHRDSLRGASIHGTRWWATADEAALINGITAHGLELDDTFEEASLHPAVVVFPAILAIADTAGHRPDEVLTAAAVGYDVMCSVGVLLGAKESYGRGFHPTGVAGALGAAAAVCSLLKLDENQTTHALGLAANMASGSLEFLSDGSWTKRLNAGQAAATGLRATRLAAAGFTAPDLALEGRDGFLNQYGQGWIEGRDLNFEFGRGAWDTSIKFYPCCRYMHGNIDLLRDIHREMPKLPLDQVDAIEVAVIAAGAALVSEPAERKLIVETPVDAQFNMRFGAAVALTTGTATVDQFDQAPTLAKQLVPWLEKVHCYESEALEQAYPASWQAEVRLKLVGGQVIERRSRAFRGSPRARASREDIEMKAAGLVGSTAAQRLSDSIHTLDPHRPLAAQIVLPALFESEAVRG
ncbi:MmgE/PrpD family protein [Pseudarthrobacter sp. NPDC058119]|uniref:MmgE/PrpD family protein n=1 Tax=Pseudarthrobacter sp. NPDC058119 TaxID=3346348 RepID=UPI0036DE25A8